MSKTTKVKVYGTDRFGKIQEDVSDAEELTRDLMTLLASFSGKYYGRRSIERRKKNKD